MYPFERFSDPAKKALTLSQEEAERAGHHYIGTEHLALGLIRTADGLAAQALGRLGVQPDGLRSALKAAMQAESGGFTKDIIPTSRVKKVIEMSFQESQRGRRPEVTTGDMLIALVAEGQGLGAQALKSLGVREGDVRAELAALSVAGVKERHTGGGPPTTRRLADRMSATRPPVEGARVLVHEPEPPHRLWEGRVVSVDQDGFVIEVPDRPAGARLVAGARLLHPIPTGPTFMCEYCRAEPAGPKEPA